MTDPVSRRRFLSRVSLALSGAIGVVVSAPILAYLLSPLIRPTRQSWQRIGSIDKFKIGKTVQVALEDPSSLAWVGQTVRTAAWLRRDSEASFTVFAVNCTHLGLPRELARRRSVVSVPVSRRRLQRGRLGSRGAAAPSASSLRSPCAERPGRDTGPWASVQLIKEPWDDHPSDYLPVVG